MTLLGLTGGIGMGKTAVAECLQRRGVPVVDTDALAHQLVEPGQPAWRAIQDTFGTGFLDAQGQLRREALARLVFSDDSKRRQLEAILHPRIREQWQAQADRWRQAGHPLAVVVIPLLFETGAAPEFDAVMCVACSTVTQRERLQSRGWSRAQVEQRNRAQWPVEQKMARAQFVLWNEGSRAVLAEQVDRIRCRLSAGFALPPDPRPSHFVP